MMLSGMSDLLGCWRYNYVDIIHPVLLCWRYVQLCTLYRIYPVLLWCLICACTLSAARIHASSARYKITDNITSRCSNVTVTMTRSPTILQEGAPSPMTVTMTRSPTILLLCSLELHIFCINKYNRTKN